ncbi:hypothetical protein D1007_32336 [Hordeum vulgare]|nr:hypothetical protein D1007_32336 [Hordeum vulgare]
MGAGGSPRSRNCSGWAKPRCYKPGDRERGAHPWAPHPRALHQPVAPWCCPRDVPAPPLHRPCIVLQFFRNLLHHMTVSRNNELRLYTTRAPEDAERVHTTPSGEDGGINTVPQ